MAIASRTATTTWEGDLPSGRGTFSDTSSGVLDEQVVTWGSRTRAPEGKSSPEELLAAAHSSCFAMAFNNRVSEEGVTPTRIDVTAEVTLEEVDGAPTITSSALTLRAEIDGLDQDAFEAAVEDAAAGCPVSRLFASADISVDAELL
ncbi:OsmC family peroxiredoxin [Flaviflexus equikiangi]|uniref:OsmC family peroxiredoxin n=1 Tax=Flaviflexus equikiangi TaxID=2758573 RepID=A0ABS2TEW5_9ACTO|nr:OsmC family peroxiredoxin [Flaviflexus equikiangi]MBM9433191.1 OsmC family peroxiredoxin [Flaviflexus equikiangi]